MVAIKSIGKIVSCIAKAEKTTLAQGDKAMFDFFKKMTSGYTPKRGKDLPRICFEGSNYEELPSFVRNLVDGLNLKRPNVTVRGRSIQKGEGILGFQICDGNKVVGTTSYGLDLTRGEPIQQLRVSIGNGTEKAISFNSILNTNLKGKSALKGDTFVNKKLAKSMGMSDEIIETIPSVKNVPATEISEQSQYLKKLMQNKGNIIHSIDECMPELAQIAKKTGKVTQQSATEAVETILSKMGYNPKDVNLTFLGKKAQESGSFCSSTGGLALNLNQLKSHQDLADIIGHELTHMEDFILFYKHKGADSFRKIIGEDFDKAWYDRMSKYVDTNKHSSSEFSVIEKELQNKAKGEQANISGAYRRAKQNIEYINSDIEKNARHTELLFKGELKNSGIYRKTSNSNSYGQAPGSYPQDYSYKFEQIDNALNKYGANKVQKFNELYEQTLYTIDNELPALFKQMDVLPAGKARNVIENKINEIIKNKHQDFEHLELKIMSGIQTKLGLQAIPESQELTLNAMQRMNLEIAEIQKALFEGRPTAEFKELAQKQDDLISKFYGNREEFGIKVAEETKKIRREKIERDLKPQFEKTDKLASEVVDAKEKLLNAYDDLISYVKKYGTKEGFEHLSNPNLGLLKFENA